MKCQIEPPVHYQSLAIWVCSILYFATIPHCLCRSPKAFDSTTRNSRNQSAKKVPTHTDRKRLAGHSYFACWFSADGPTGEPASKSSSRLPAWPLVGRRRPVLLSGQCWVNAGLCPSTVYRHFAQSERVCSIRLLRGHNQRGWTILSSIPDIR